MADAKITALTELTSVDDSDLLAIVDDPSGTPLTKKITRANLLSDIAEQGTATSVVSDAHTTNNTWEDITSMSVSVSPGETVNLVCLFTCVIDMASTNWEQNSFRFDLDGSTQSEEYYHHTNSNADTNLFRLITIHTVFESVASGSHTVKAQWKSPSDLNVNFITRRITVLVCQ